MNETAPRVIKIPAKPESVRQAELQRQLRVAALVEGGLLRLGRFVFRGQEVAFVEFLMTDSDGTGHACVSRQKNGLLGGQAV